MVDKYFDNVKYKELSDEKKDEYKKLGKQRDKIQRLFEKAPEGTKEKGDYLLEYITVTEKQFKIYSHFTDRKGLDTVKMMYKSGIRLKKWKR